MRRLNLKYARKNKPTDVLAFPLGENHLLGDIIISIEKAKRQAKEFNKKIIDEICFLGAHGLLHLLGYDHRTERGLKVMNRIASSILIAQKEQIC